MNDTAAKCFLMKECKGFNTMHEKVLFMGKKNYKFDIGKKMFEKFSLNLFLECQTIYVMCTFVY